MLSQRDPKFSQTQTVIPITELNQIRGKLRGEGQNAERLKEIERQYYELQKKEGAFPGEDSAMAQLNQCLQAPKGSDEVWPI